MTDRIEEVLAAQIEHLLKVNAMLSTGTMSTRTEGRDSTQQTIEENMVSIADLQEALRRHRLRNG